MRTSLFLAKIIYMIINTWNIKDHDHFIKAVLKIAQEERNDQECGKQIHALLQSDEHVDKPKDK